MTDGTKIRSATVTPWVNKEGKINTFSEHWPSNLKSLRREGASPLFELFPTYLTTRILVTNASGLLKPSLAAEENTRYTPVAAV